MTKKYTVYGKEKDAHGKIGDVLEGEEMIVYEIIDNEDGSISVKSQLNVYTKLGRFEKHIEEDMIKEE